MSLLCREIKLDTDHRSGFVVHCNINASGAGTGMIDRINRVRRNFELRRMKFSRAHRQIKIAR
jgi:hypothetical protein